MNPLRASGFPALRQKSIRLFAFDRANRIERSLRIVVALAVLVTVATVLIAPSIDMPETTLREHHVTSHSTGNHSSGNLTSLGTTALLHVVHAIDTHRPLDGPQFSMLVHGQSSLVLRC